MQHAQTCKTCNLADEPAEFLGQKLSCILKASCDHRLGHWGLHASLAQEEIYTLFVPYKFYHYVTPNLAFLVPLCSMRLTFGLRREMHPGRWIDVEPGLIHTACHQRAIRFAQFGHLCMLLRSYGICACFCAHIIPFKIETRQTTWICSTTTFHIAALERDFGSFSRRCSHVRVGFVFLVAARKRMEKEVGRELWYPKE